MAQVLHIKDAYFKLPDKHNENIGCMVTLFGLHLQQKERQKAEHMRKVAKNPFYRMACMVGLI